MLAELRVGERPSDVVIAPDGGRAYVLNGWRDTSVIDTVAGTVTATVGLPGFPNGAAVSPDGTRVYMAGGRQLMVLDAAGLVVLTTIPLGGFPTEVLISPDGQRLFVTDEDADTVSVVDAANLTVLTTVPIGFSINTTTVLSPDGRTLYAFTQPGGSSELLSIIEYGDEHGSCDGAGCRNRFSRHLPLR